MSSTIDAIRDRIKRSEGEILYPYLDNKGLITIGVGFNVDRKEDFLALPLETKDAKSGKIRPATDAEKQAAYEAMAKARNDANGNLNREANEYEDTTSLRLPKSAIDSKLDAEIAKRTGAIKKDIGEAAWNKLSDAQKAALTDIHYANGSLDKFPKLKEAAKAGDAKGMAENSHFHSGEDEDGALRRNWDRIRENHCGMLGLDAGSDACFRSVADHYRKNAPDEKLPESFDKYRSEEPKKDAPKRNPPSDDLPKPDPDAPMDPEQVAGAEEKERIEGSDKTDAAAEPSPELDRVLARMKGELENPALSVALKAPKDWTEAERDLVIRDYQERPGHDPLKPYLTERTAEWFKHVYGDGPAKYDETGRMMEPETLGEIPAQPKSPVTREGQDFGQAMNRMAAALKRTGEEDGIAEGVKALQRGLNLAEGQPERLAEDGDYGPKTDFELKRRLAADGTGQAENLWALGRFDRYAERARKEGDAEDLGQAVEKILGPLFRADFRKGPKPEAGAFQESLNELGARRFGADWKPIDVDDDIGPKTKAAFRDLLRAVEPDELTRSLGRSLGFI